MSSLGMRRSSSPHRGRKDVRAWGLALFALVALGCDDDGQDCPPFDGGPPTGMDARVPLADAGAPSPDTGPPLPTAQPPVLYGERWRPQVHYSPPYGWMNDPNGLVHVNGVWHLFYQSNPLGDGFGFLSWGHAVSDDLARWQPVGVAIPYEGRTLIFSGGAVVDERNTSGLCDPDAAARGDCVIAIYTANVTTDEGVVQNQNLAFSNDGGIRFQRFDGNPVLDIGAADFRDPKVFWHAPSERWIQVLALPIERQVAIYGSPNLRDWELLSTFGPTGAVGGIWECPDLFELPVEGEPDERRWVMKVDLNPGHVAGGSGGQYFLGEFDGTTFVPTGDVEAPRWLDWAPDFYCATTWSDAPGDEKHWIGWMNDWRYAGAAPTFPWRGQMTLPRRVTLIRRGDGLELAQAPEPSLEDLRGTPRTVSGDAAAVSTFLSELPLTDAWEMVLEMQPSGAASTELLLTQDGGDPYAIVRLLEGNLLEVERPDATNAEVAPTFPGVFRAPLPASDGTLRLRIVVDRSSVEVFTADGSVVMTALVFPTGEPNGAALVSGEAGRFEATVWPLRSSWR